MKEITIVTYGGGEILFQLFTGIKMIFSSDIIKYLSYLMACISAIYAIFNTYFSSNPDNLVKHFLIPMVALVVLCFSVKTTVYIEDMLPLTQGGINLISREALELNKNKNVEHVSDPQKSVDGVPFFIGFISQAISTIGHKITVAVEDIFHTVDGDKYTKTGIIFGAETALDMNEIIINDGNLSSNLRTFCNTCMLYDLALGLYTIENLKNESNLLEFLKRKTAKSRFMNYVSSENNAKNNSELISCEQSIERIAKVLEKGGIEVAHQEKKQIFRNLPIAYQALTKQSGDSAEIIQQMLVMSVVADEMSSDAFASKRAALQQKTSWKTMGGIADGLVITTRCVIEALVYGAVILVVPLMFLPSGFSYIKTWVWLLVWIQLWPPFFVILDYISLIAARGQAEGLFDASKCSTCCLTLYNTIGLSNIYGNISAYAKSMKILIPPLSYAILQGGVGSFVHMANSMTGTSQQAASMAASDEVSGNYSFGNTNMDTSGFANATYGQQNYAASLTSGFVRQSDIQGTTTYGSKDSNINENRSSFTFGLSEDKAIQSSLASTMSNTQTAHEASSYSLSSSLSNAGRTAMDYTSHLANDTSYSIGNNTTDSQEYSKSAQYCENQIESFAKDHNISTQCAWEVFISAGASLPFDIASAGLSNRYGLISSSTYNDAKSISESEEFREAYNNIQNHAINHSKNESDSEGSRLSNSFTSSIDQMKSSSEAFSVTLDKLNQASETANFYNSLGFTERSDLSQKLLDYSVDDRGYSVNQFKDLIHNENDADELTGLISDFSSSRMPETFTPEGFASPDEFHSESLNKIPDFSPEVDREFVLNKASVPSSSNREKVENKLQNPYDHNEKIEEIREDIKNTKETLKPTKNQESELTKREVDLELNWDTSFDDDYMPNYGYFSYWWQ